MPQLSLGEVNPQQTKNSATPETFSLVKTNVSKAHPIPELKTSQTFMPVHCSGDNSEGSNKSVIFSMKYQFFQFELETP